MVLDNQEEAVRQGEQWFRKIFDHSHDAIVIIDLASDSILEANPRALYNASILPPRTTLHAGQRHPSPRNGKASGLFGISPTRGARVDQ